MMNSKMADHHLARQACIYIRQSRPGQVRFNQESKERQYNLANQAKALGWMPERIRILDGDLGHSGEQATHRDDFKTLVSDVAMGQVGAIFSLEASRLARSNKDWHRLLELCAITKTLVFDGDGCYDPADFNDGLVLGIKGQFAQAELHIIRARLHGAKLNKAQKGELRFPVPVGFVYDGDKIVLDPDQEVQGAVRAVFELFEQENSAYGVVQRFHQLGLRFPRRAYGGAWDGKLIWGRLTHSRVIGGAGCEGARPEVNLDRAASTDRAEVDAMTNERSVSRWWANWQRSLIIVQSATVLRWRRRGFRAIRCGTPSLAGLSSHRRPCTDCGHIALPIVLIS